MPLERQFAFKGDDPPTEDQQFEYKPLSLADMLTTEEKLNFITRRQSFLQDADALKRLLEEKPKLKLAWETTPTGKRMSPSN